MTDLADICNDIDAIGLSPSHSCPPGDCLRFINSGKKSIKILHFNIRSISCNFLAFLPLLAMIKTECEIIILTECWLQKVINIPIIPGFHFHATKNNTNQNDGVVLYIKDNINCSVIEPQLYDGSCLVCRIGQFTAVVAIYRSPSFKNTDRFITSLSDVLQSLSSFRDIVLTGDLNIDIKESSKEPCKRDELLKCLLCMAYFQHI